MNAFILERLTSTGWHRGGETYWTLDAAEKAAGNLLRRKLARLVRVLPVVVDPNAVSEVSPPSSVSKGAKP